MKRNDILWKAVLEDLFDDFLRFFYPNANKLFDMERGFEYLDKELDQLFPPEGDQYAPRYVDKLVKVFTNAGTEEWILVHIEVQAYSDKDFSKRMFQYYYRILDKYDRPITAFAIFADNNKNFHPKSYERNFLGTKISYFFNTYKIIEQPDALLEASDNPFAIAVLSAKLALAKPGMEEQQLAELAYNLARRLLSKQIPKEKVRKLMSFLRYYIHFENSAILSKFTNDITALTERKTTMGIEEFLLDQAKKEGMTQKEMEKDQTFTRSLLSSTDFSTAIIAQLVGVSEDFVLKIKNELDK
jgi:hypothetical protein